MHGADDGHFLFGAVGGDGNAAAVGVHAVDLLLELTHFFCVGLDHVFHHIVEPAAHECRGSRAAAGNQRQSQNGGQNLFPHRLPGLLLLIGFYGRFGLGAVSIFLPGRLLLR